MKKWAFFLDIDGTVAVNGKITEENILAVNDAVRNGHYIFLCTGRPYAMAKQFLGVANWSGIICSMGAEIILNGEFVRKETIPDSFAKIVAEEIFKTGSWVIMGNGDICLSLNERHDVSFTRVDNIEEFANKLDGITKIDIWGEVSESLKALICEKMDIITHPGYSESSVKGLSKSESIAFVLDKINIDREFSVAIGDSLNDIDMIEYAGVGVAMGNAIDEVKKVADIIADDCEACGVAKIIREFMN